MIIPDSPWDGWGNTPRARLMVGPKVKNPKIVLLLYPRLITLSVPWALYWALLIWLAQSSGLGSPTLAILHNLKLER